MKLDALDLKILGTLQANGRLSNQELADLVALSPSACHRRVKLLEEHGYIEGYNATLSAPKLGFRIEAFVELDISQLNEAAHDYFAREIQAMDEVVNAFIITGKANYLLYVRTRDFEEFSQFIVNRLNKLRGVTRIHSQIVLDKLKSRGKFVPIGGLQGGAAASDPD